MANVGAATTGGIKPSKRSPVSGSSAETRGEAGCTSAPTGWATRRTTRSPSAAEQSLTRVGQTLSQPVDPEATVWVQHHLDDGGVFEPAGNRWPQCGAQHAGAAGDRFCPQ